MNPNWQLANLIICILAASSSFYLAIYTWRRHYLTGARWFSILVALIGWVAVCYAFESSIGADLNAYVAFSKLEYVGLTFIPLTWLGMALAVSDIDYVLTRRQIALLAFIPALTVALAWTNEWHGLIWAEPRFELISMPPVYAATYGVGFWIYTLYAYVVFLAGSLILVRMALRSWALYRAQ